LLKYGRHRLWAEEELRKRRIAIAVGSVFVAALLIAIVILDNWPYLVFPESYSLPFSLDANPVIAHRLAQVGMRASPPDTPPLHDFNLEGDPVPVPPDVAAQLRKILGSHATYKFNVGQCFVPGMAITFGEGADHIDVLICLYCDSVQYYQGDHMVHRSLSHEGKQRLWEMYRRIFGMEPVFP
jgi:hypothetical protein